MLVRVEGVWVFLLFFHQRVLLVLSIDACDEKSVTVFFKCLYVAFRGVLLVILFDFRIAQIIPLGIPILTEWTTTKNAHVIDIYFKFWARFLIHFLIIIIELF